MDRVYLPQADLVRHGIGRHQLLVAGAGLQETPAFRALMAEQVQRARQAYAEAFALLPPADRRRQRRPAPRFAMHNQSTPRDRGEPIP